MNGSRTMKWMACVLTALALCGAESAWACAACYGKSDSALAEGMNWGIFSLLAVVVCVLGGIASFFIYLARRAAAAPETMLTETPKT